VKTDDGLVDLDDLGVQRDTSVGEIAARLDVYRRSRCLPVADGG